MQESQNKCRLEKEETALKRLLGVEDLAEKKARIFSRLLTDVALAKEMESLAKRHEQRKGVLLNLLGQKPQKKEEQQ